MRLVNFHVLAGGFFVMRHKCRVVVFVKLPRHIVRTIEQGLRRSQRAAGQNKRSQSGFESEVHGVLKFKKKQWWPCWCARERRRAEPCRLEIQHLLITKIIAGSCTLSLALHKPGFMTAAKMFCMRTTVWGAVCQTPTTVFFFVNAQPAYHCRVPPDIRRKLIIYCTDFPRYSLGCKPACYGRVRCDTRMSGPLLNISTPALQP